MEEVQLFYINFWNFPFERNNEPINIDKLMHDTRGPALGPTSARVPAPDPTQNPVVDPVPGTAAGLIPGRFCGTHVPTKTTSTTNSSSNSSCFSSVQDPLNSGPCSKKCPITHSKNCPRSHFVTGCDTGPLGRVLILTPAPVPAQDKMPKTQDPLACADSVHWLIDVCGEMQMWLIVASLFLLQVSWSAVATAAVALIIRCTHSCS
jgi:hypothetical protein